MWGVVQIPRLPSCQAGFLVRRSRGGAGISKLGEIPGAAQVALPATARGHLKLLLRGNRRAPGTAAAAGRLFPGRSFIRRSGRLCGFRSARGRAFPIRGTPPQDTCRLAGNCARALNCCLVGHSLPASRHRAALGPDPGRRYQAFTLVLGVFPSLRCAFRSLEIYQTPHTPLAGNSPHAPSCRTASRPAYEHQPCGFHGRLCG